MPTKAPYVDLMKKLSRESNWQMKPNGTRKTEVGPHQGGLRVTVMDNGHGLGACFAVGRDKYWVNKNRYETTSDFYRRIAVETADIAEEANLLA